MRLFIAIPLPEELRRRIAGFQDLLKKEWTRLKYVRPEAMHVTLAFLGDRSGEELERARRALHFLRPITGPFDAACSGLGAFPENGKPRVLFMPFSEGSDVMEKLASRLAGSLAGMTDAREAFHAHVTLARNQDLSIDRKRFGELSATFGAPARFSIERIVLFHSILRPEGPEYREVETLSLR